MEVISRNKLLYATWFDALLRRAATSEFKQGTLPCEGRHTVDIYIAGYGDKCYRVVFL